MKNLIVLFLTTISIMGCATPSVRTSSTIFQGQDHLKRGTIAVLPFDKSQEGSLEFQAVSNHLLKNCLKLDTSLLYKPVSLPLLHILLTELMLGKQQYHQCPQLDKLVEVHHIHLELCLVVQDLEAIVEQQQQCQHTV